MELTDFQTDVLLSKYSTFGIGGPAKFFIKVTSIQQMEDVLKFSQKHEIPYFILGRGSNCLFDDKGLNGLVILNRIDYLNFDENRCVAGSGASFAKMCIQASRLNLSGLEFGCGIPGSVGGAVFMNAGAHQKCCADVLESVVFLDKQNQIIKKSAKELSFSYRHSPFQLSNECILEASFKLEPSDEACNKQAHFLQHRQTTQPWKDRSAGCVFRNPNLMSAGKCIEQVGLKNYRIGGACVSEKHANFIVNDQGACTQDVLSLIKVIQEKVYSEYKILLQTEVCVVPYELK